MIDPCNRRRVLALILCAALSGCSSGPGEPGASLVPGAWTGTGTVTVTMEPVRVAQAGPVPDQQPVRSVTMKVTAWRGKLQRMPADERDNLLRATLCSPIHGVPCKRASRRSRCSWI